MAYKFEISPPKRLQKNESDDENYEILYLAPFKPFPKVTFQNVKINTTVSRCLVIRNPSNSAISVELLPLPPNEHGFGFSFTSAALTPGEEAILKISWTPSEVGSWRHTIPVRTSSKFKSEIVLISSCVNPQTKKTVKKSTVSKTSNKPTVLAKKLVLPKLQKFQTGKPTASSSMVQQHVRIAPALPRNAASSPCRRQTFLVSAEQQESNLGPGKKMKICETNHDISRKFEDFVLSPLNPNLNFKQSRCRVLDDLVMSPVVLPVQRPDVDFVDGDASAHSKVLPSVPEDSENASISEIRRATFDIGNPVYASETFKKPLPTNLPMISVVDEKDEFSDSLEEVCIEKEVLASPGNSVPLEARDSFMNSTIQFDLSFPCEDPRRCSTGVKIFPEEDVPSGARVRKDLFDMMVSPASESKVHDRLTFDLGLNISHHIDSLSGLVPGSVDAASNDRLSTETYVKDRLSTSTYVKDRLSTETYVKEHHSRGSSNMNEESSDHSVFLLDSVHTNSANGQMYSPRVEEHLHLQKSPLLSIEEEVTSFNALDNRPNKGMVFTIDFSKDANGEMAAKPNSKFSKPKPTLQQKTPPRRRRLVEVSPTLKKSIAGLSKSKLALNAKTPNCVQPKGISSVSKLKLGGVTATATTSKPDKRLSMSSFESRLSLSSRLPATSLSLSRREQPVFKVPRGSKRIAEMQAAKSETLHNFDDILAEVTNVDPFAASTSSDPFLNCAIFNNSDWIARQTTDIIRWLNALLTPPAELDTNVDMLHIDVGDLWQKTCREKNVNLAPSREEVSSDHYNKQHRLNTLRKAALTLIRSKEVAGVLQKISVRVDNKLLSVREDRDLHLDVGLQQGVLELLLCYNPLWLRIGLEAVYGRTVPLKSNCDYVGLMAFLVHNLLSDKHIVATYSHPTVPNLKLPGFQDEMKRFTLKKFLFLVYFLDVAKSRGIIKHDPCLFLRTAKLKESRDIVAAYARDLLAGIGDVNRYLASLGCRLTVKQTYLEEFEYAVNNLLDLRDGIRLVRVMEIILQDTTLIKGLRVPAISRLQKIHNVDIALKALTAAGYEVSGGITAKDIVDGHREKTLSLLWQIIYKFQAPRFTDAALIVQRWWRRICLPREIDRRIRARKRATREAAVVKIQSTWRGQLARRRASNLREERARKEEARCHAAVVLQKHWRRHAAQMALRRAREEEARCHAAVVLQKHWRRHAAQMALRRAREEEARCHAAVVLQKHWRRHAAQMALRRAREEEARCHAAVVLQKHWRRHAAQMVLRRARDEEARRNAAVVLQKHWRRHAAQMVLHRSRQAVTTITKWYRGLIKTRLHRDDFVRRRAAAVKLQAHCRGMLTRKRFTELRRMAAALRIQTWLRRQRASRRLLAAAEVAREILRERRRQEEACRRIQAWLRRQRASRRLLAAAEVAREILRERRRQEEACRRIQAWLRRQRASRRLLAAAEVAREVLRERRRQEEACRRIQAWLRRQRASRRLLAAAEVAREILRERRRQEEACRRIQTWLRRQRASRRLLAAAEVAREILRERRRQEEACRRIQAWLRRQRASRRLLAAAEVAREILRERRRQEEACRRIQTWLRRQRASRRLLAAAEVAREILRERRRQEEACRRIQAWLRRQRASRRLLAAAEVAREILRERRRQEEACRRIQAWLRRQRASRRLLAAAEVAREVLRDRRRQEEACRRIQTWLRRQRASRRLLAAAEVAREVLLERRRQEEACRRGERLEAAVVAVQRRWRGLLATRAARRHFLAVRNAALVLQGKFRARMAERAATVFQKYTRGFLARKRFNEKKQAQLQEENEKQRTTAAIKIQAHFRGHMSRRKFQEETEQLKRLAEHLQSNATECKSMKDRITTLCVDLDLFTVGSIVYILNSLHTICMISPVLCEEMVENDIVARLFRILCNVNRGVADSAIARLSTRILLCLSKYSKTTEAVWKDGSYLHLYPHLMKKWISVGDSVLLNFLTILWHFSQCEDKAQVILSDDKLKSTILFFLTKYKSRKGKSVALPGTLPSNVPNWGNLKKESRPFSFEDPLYGIRALCFKLKIDTNV